MFASKKKRKSRQNAQDQRRYVGDELEIFETYAKRYGEQQWSSIEEEVAAFDAAYMDAKQARDAGNKAQKPLREERDKLTSLVKQNIAEVKRLQQLRDEQNACTASIKKDRAKATERLRQLRSELDGSDEAQARLAEAEVEQQTLHDKVVESAERAEQHHAAMMEANAVVEQARQQQEEAHKSVKRAKRESDKHHWAMQMFIARRNMLRDLIREEE